MVVLRRGLVVVATVPGDERTLNHRLPLALWACAAPRVVDGGGYPGSGSDADDDDGGGPLTYDLCHGCHLERP